MQRYTLVGFGVHQLILLFEHGNAGRVWISVFNIDKGLSGQDMKTEKDTRGKIRMTELEVETFE